MTRIEVLKALYDEYMDRIFETSANWRMNTPKIGYENTWKTAVEIISVLKELIKENGGAV